MLVTRHLLPPQRLPESPLITCRLSSPTLPSLNPNTLPNSSSLASSPLLCPHFQSCSGCTQELNLNRPVVVEEAAEFFKKRGVSDFSFESSKLWEWRCRAKLAVRGSSKEPLIGLYREGTHSVIDIPLCKAHHPSINSAVDLLREGIRELDIEPYDEDKMTGDLRYVQMAVTTYNTNIPAPERYKSGKVQVALVWNSRNGKSPNSEKLLSLAKYIWGNGGRGSNLHLIHSLWANFQTTSNNIIFGNKWKHLLGEIDFWERVGGIDVSLPPSSFGQANTLAFDSLLRKLQKYVPYGSSVTDLYAGGGVIGLSLAATRKCRSVRCVEVNRESMFSFEKSTARLPSTVKRTISWHHADASSEPYAWLKGSEVVVVDPPRKGLDPSVIDALLSLKDVKKKATPSSDSSSAKPKEEKRPWILRARESSLLAGDANPQSAPNALPDTLLYISCGWESFKADCESLTASKDWRLEKAHGFNFFPGTQSIEVLAVFKRRQGVAAKKKKPKKIKNRTKSDNSREL